MGPGVVIVPFGVEVVGGNQEAVAPGGVKSRRPVMVSYGGSVDENNNNEFAPDN